MDTDKSTGGWNTAAEAEPEHRWLRKLVGEWTYEAPFDMPGQPPGAMRGTDTVRSIGDMWIVSEGRGETPEYGAYHNIITLGYDPKRKRFVGTFIDGSMPFLWKYDGWLEGNVLTLESVGQSMENPDQMANYRDVLEFITDDHRTMRSLVEGPDGTWVEFMMATQRRKA
jgi:hypothetical protein